MRPLLVLLLLVTILAPARAEALMLTPAWTVEGNQAGASLGQSVASAGDVNNDGFDDVIVGAPGYDDGELDEGAVFVYYGSAAGVPATPSWKAESNMAANTYRLWTDFGAAVASAGDINGDHASDIIVGAPNYHGGKGAVFVWYGAPTGLGTDGTPANADWSVIGSHNFGETVASAGDLNGDTFSDIVIGAPGPTHTTGTAYVWYGGPQGLSGGRPGRLSNANWKAEGAYDASEFGYAVASAGDVNGDGFDELIVGAFAHNDHQVFVWYGSAAGLPGRTGTPANASWRAYGDDELGIDRFGYSVASAGDVNGDGFDDIIAGNPPVTFLGPSGPGVAFLWYGSAGGLGPDGTPSNADWRADGDVQSASMGSVVASAGDVNGDGFDDVLVAAGSQGAEGRVYLWYGHLAGMGPNGTPSNADWQVEGSKYYNKTVSSAGDVNGDGFDDVIIGTSYYSNPESYEGKASLYLGGP